MGLVQRELVSSLHHTLDQPHLLSGMEVDLDASSGGFFEDQCTKNVGFCWEKNHNSGYGGWGFLRE